MFRTSSWSFKLNRAEEHLGTLEQMIGSSPGGLSCPLAEYLAGPAGTGPEPVAHSCTFLHKRECGLELSRRRAGQC